MQCKTDKTHQSDMDSTDRTIAIQCHTTDNTRKRDDETDNVNSVFYWYFQVNQHNCTTVYFNNLINISEAIEAAPSKERYKQSRLEVELTQKT